MKLISVNEKLPEDTSEKLLYNNNEEWKGGIAEWNFGWYDGERWVFATRDFWTQEYITHWCDLEADI